MATSIATIETLVVMTRCSVGTNQGSLRDGSANTVASTIVGDRTSASSTNGRHTTVLTTATIWKGLVRTHGARDLGQQQVEVERLLHVVAHAERGRMARQLGDGGPRDDRHVVVLVHAARERPAVHHRHH